MTANCNISKIALDLINKVRYGLSCSDMAEKLLVQSYLHTLDCNPKQLYCLPESNCQSHTKTHNCNFYINSIDFIEEVDGETLKGVEFKLGNFGEANLPISYEWSFDDTDFILAPGSSLTSDKLILRIKNNNVDSEVMVGVTCIDSEGCIATKTCEYTYKPLGGDAYQYTSGMGCLF